ncbi:MAG: DUF2157 domain-containing protein [Pseudomonadota bacterium]
MSGFRNQLLDWTAQGRLPASALPAALQLAEVAPAGGDWRHFFDRLCLWLGAIFLAAAVIFFFAYNWQEMGRFAKFGLVELLIAGTALLAWRLGLEHASGKAALLAIALLIGALLALVGQTYQTGADTYELFAAWAIAILPLAAVGRFGALWLFWTGLLNLALVFYFQTFGGIFGLLFSTEKQLWALFALNTAALCVWEICAWRWVGWLQQGSFARWPPRIWAVASGGLVTALALYSIFEFYRSGATAALVYLLWIAAAYAVYRHALRDIFVLVGGVLSAIIVVSALLSKLMLSHDEGGAFLLIGMIVIGLSAAGGLWLKKVATEDAQ